LTRLPLAGRLGIALAFGLALTLPWGVKWL
jgi:hypothetical protein